MDPTPPDLPEATEAFLRLLTQNESWLATYVYSLVPHSADADDILQECKMTLWKHFSKFEPGTNFRAWARKVATYQILNHRRSARRHPSAALEESFIEAVATEIDRQARHLEQKADLLRQCLHQLPPQHRQIVVWRYYDGLEIGEIAAKSLRTDTAVYRLLSRIRKLLNDCVSRKLHLAPLS